MSDIDVDWLDGETSSRRISILRSVADAWRNAAKGALTAGGWVLTNDVPGSPGRWIAPDTHTRFQLEAAIAIWRIDARRQPERRAERRLVACLAELDAALCAVAGWTESTRPSACDHGALLWLRPGGVGDGVCVELAAQTIRVSLAARRP